MLKKAETAAPTVFRSGSATMTISIINGISILIAYTILQLRPFSIQSAHVGRSAEAVRFSKADTYVGNIRSAVMGGIGPLPAVLGANFKDTVEKFLTPSATHNSMTKAAFIACYSRHVAWHQI
jgi:hypothetical protein